MLDEPGATEEVVDSLRSGLELRVVEELPMKLVLADADLALVPLDPVGPAGEPGAVLLQRSGLLAALDALFESVWRAAYPLELSSLGGAHGRRGPRPTAPTAARPPGPEPAARRARATRRSPPSSTCPCGRSAPAPRPAGPGRRADPDAARLVRRPARLGLRNARAGPGVGRGWAAPAPGPSQPRGGRSSQRTRADPAGGDAEHRAGRDRLDDPRHGGPLGGLRPRRVHVRSRGSSPIYLLAQAISVPLYGKLADLLRPQAVDATSASELFIRRSLLCGVRLGMTALIVFRARAGARRGRDPADRG